MYLEALWTLEVSSSSGWIAAGVVIFQPRRVFGDFFESGRILGGDGSHFYSGEYAVENLALTAEIRAVRYAGGTTHTGLPDEFVLEVSTRLESTVRRDVIQLPARLLEQRHEAVTLRLTKREDA